MLFLFTPYLEKTWKKVVCLSMKRKNYFFSLFCFCLLISAVPALAIGLFSYEYSRKVMGQNLETIYAQNLTRSIQWTDHFID